MWTFIQAILASVNLHLAAHELPDVRPDLVDPFVDAAVAESTPRVPAALVVALGWGESRFDPSVRTGSVCGVMQVNPVDIGHPHKECDQWTKDVQAGVHAGVVEIEMLLADSRVKGNLYAALLYRACGNVAFTGKCSAAKVGWVNAALSRFHILSRQTPLKEW